MTEDPITYRQKHPTPEGSIFYRWAIDSGKTHDEAVQIAKEAIKERAQRPKLTPEQWLKERIQYIRETVAPRFNLSPEETEKRIKYAIGEYQNKLKTQDDAHSEKAAIVSQ